IQSTNASSGMQHAVWVNRQYVEVRRPSLSYRFSRYVRADLLNHFALLTHSIGAFLELRTLLKREHFDLVHAHTRGTLFVALSAAKLLQRPVLFTNHSYGSRIRMYQRVAAAENMHTVLLTPNMSRHYGLLANFPKLTIIPDCCADSFFSETLCAPRPVAPEGLLRLAGVGNIMRWKNWHLLVRALRALTPAEKQRIDFSLWGPRPSDPDSVRYDRELRRLVASSGLHAQFRFRGLTHSIPDCLREADWFVLPSTNEPCSVALIEALAMGLPALASASGGNVDILCHGKTGLLFEPDNSADLAEKLRLLLRGRGGLCSPQERRNSVRHRSGSSVMEEYAAIYKCLAG
ncbi:MAG: glycosyltransferase family 4 protein, partial [Verrucomicrobiales bacterium]|nr:glycosyltransferase family 4 protein [Verrucomicrobiales bacterium]